MTLYRRLYSWNSVPNSPIQDAMSRQEEFVRKEFDDRYNQVGQGWSRAWIQVVEKPGC